ncbi:FAD binding domain-containing protein [Mycobacterium yunnanensis]|uniref:FAD binding domain-containing protein n=1 Tax=Mycobacterium yunnanensis TaxID=368477 RepID=A0A9X2Z3N2_9MYCO|nr:FAD binding domain-containing protein [Mycobacterium yunnanensis]MCV7422131.1 FAD binding domain-containing protein [Mycobacterium yunnanensis]
MSTFRTVVPKSQDDVAGVLARADDVLLIGGGTLTVPALVRGDVRPSLVVDLGRAGMDRIEVQPDAIRIGALVCYQQLLDCEGVRTRLPLLHRLCSGITGGIQIRNQGTLVGALCAARPQSDGPAALVALGADVVVRSSGGSRVVGASEFMRGAEDPDLGPDEFVTAIHIPFQNSDSGYVKVKFAESSWPVLTAAAASGHVVIGGVADVPQRIPLPDLRVDAVRGVVAEHLDRIAPPQRWSDLRADWDYRRRVAPEVAVRAVSMAFREVGHD